jgi:hypothetical protein
MHPIQRRAQYLADLVGNMEASFVIAKRRFRNQWLPAAVLSK